MKPKRPVSTSQLGDEKALSTLIRLAFFLHKRRLYCAFPKSRLPVCPYKTDTFFLFIVSGAANLVENDPRNRHPGAHAPRVRLRLDDVRDDERQKSAVD